MQTYDRQTNQYLDHDHEEYALAREVASIADIERLQALIQDLIRKYTETKKFTETDSKALSNLSQYSVSSTSKLREDLDTKTSDLLERIQKRSLNLSAGILDAGTFTDPEADIIIDAGGFDETSPEVLKEDRIKEELSKRLGELEAKLNETLGGSKEELNTRASKIEEDMGARLEKLSSALKTYATKVELKDLAPKEHKHSEYALKSSLEGVARVKDIPSDYVSAKQLKEAIIAVRQAITPVDEERIVKDVLKRVKVPKNVEKVVEIRTEVANTEKIEERLNKIEEDLENSTEKAELMHRHKIADVAGLAQALQNTGGGGQVDTVVAGDGVIVDSTDPANPVVSINREYIIAYSIML